MAVACVWHPEMAVGMLGCVGDGFAVVWRARILLAAAQPSRAAVMIFLGIMVTSDYRN